MLFLFKPALAQKNQENLKQLKRKELSSPLKGGACTPRQNSSRVRDHLANERTYLAWMRTAISLMGFGVVIVRLRFFKPPIVNTPGNGWKLGLIFSFVGLITVLLSTFHYFTVRHDIDEDIYQPPDRWVLLFSLTVVLLATGIIYYVFTLPLSPINTLVFE